MTRRMVQELPPSGGFRKLEFKSRIPGPRISGSAMVTIAAGVVGYGLYQVVKGNQQRNRIKKEVKMVGYIPL